MLCVRPQEPTGQSQLWWCAVVIPALGRWGEEELWAHGQASQLSLLGEVWPSGSDREPTAEVGLWPPYSGTHTSVNTHMQRKGKETGTPSRPLVRKH